MTVDGTPLGPLQAALAARFPAEDHIVPDLDRIAMLCELLGDPQKAFPSIHLTGTNGKTSTARMVDALLRSFGLRPGRYTSPHLESLTERICLDGVPVDDVRLAEAYEELRPYLELVDSRSSEPMTFFEVLTGLAFAVFADAPVDAGVIEVGVGGAWDATNVLQAQTCVVLPVGLDHVPLLGTTLAEIAAQKAGIVHAGATVVLAAQPPEAAEVLLRHCAEVGATIAREGLEFGVLGRATAVGGQLVTLQGLTGVYEDVFLPLHGVHQAANAAAALAAVEAFLGGTGSLDPEAVRDGFAQVDAPGRLEVLRTSPTVLVDAGHNAAGMVATVHALTDAFAFTHLVGVVAVLGDKDARGMLEVLEPALSQVVVTQTRSPRALPVDELAEIARDVFGEDRVAVEDGLDDAIDTAVSLSEQEAELGSAGVLVTGSVVTAGEARRLLKR
ncbi:MAG: FolC bifunctional protein [Frankiales bacterium]|nr:FolC bifunctional protein [Frankiales bacterium]